MKSEEISEQIKKKELSKKEQVRLLRKQRVQLLDEIHVKQQLLDRLDYMIYEIEKEKR